MVLEAESRALLLLDLFYNEIAHFTCSKFLMVVLLDLKIIPLAMVIKLKKHRIKSPFLLNITFCLQYSGFDIITISKLSPSLLNLSGIFIFVHRIKSFEQVQL